MIWTTIDNKKVLVNGKALSVISTEKGLLTGLYRQYVNDYPKYFKMDGLCRLGFVVSELLFDRESCDRFVERDDRGVVLFGCTGSADADRRYQATISDSDNYYPSPSIFVYTLPNIVTGEIAIRNKYHGETAFYLLGSFSPKMMANTVACAFDDETLSSVVCGWLEYTDENHFQAMMFIVERKEIDNTENIIKQIENIYKQI